MQREQRQVANHARHHTMMAIISDEESEDSKNIDRVQHDSDSQGDVNMQNYMNAVAKEYSREHHEFDPADIQTPYRM